MQSILIRHYRGPTVRLSACIKIDLCPLMARKLLTASTLALLEKPAQWRLKMMRTKGLVLLALPFYSQIYLTSIRPI